MRTFVEVEFKTVSDIMRRNVINESVAKQTRVQRLNREEILQKSATKGKVSNQAVLILTHPDNTPNVNAILRQHCNTLEQSEQLKSVIPEPLRGVYRRARNIGDILTSSKVNQCRK